MIRLSYCTMVLIAASCYIAVSSDAKAVQQGAREVDLPNRINGGKSSGSVAYSRVTSSSSSNIEARRKRAMGDYKELNDLIDDLEENTLTAANQQRVTNANNNGNGNNLLVASSSSPSSLPTQEYDLDNMPPLAYYMLLQKLRQLAEQSNAENAYRMRTPRLGRSIDFQRLLGGATSRDSVGGGGVGGAAGGDDETVGVSRQFVSRMMKKSVPFKPRLGKRAQVCGGSGSSSNTNGGGSD